MVDMSTESQRNAVVSAANLLMVALLKMNRVMIPMLLRWRRGRRQNWIRRASIDVAAQMDRSTARPRLCAGACCGGSFASIIVNCMPEARDVHPQIVNAWLQAGGDTSAASIAQMVHAVGPKPDRDAGVESDGAVVAYAGKIPPDEDASSASTIGLSHRGKDPVIAQSPDTNDKPYGLTNDDVYFRLKTLEEERHRSSTVIPLTYTSVMAIYCTILSMIIYASGIIHVVLSSFSFETWEAIIFAFSLVSTAMISESETLMKVKKKSTQKSSGSAAPGFSLVQNPEAHSAAVNAATMSLLHSPNTMPTDKLGIAATAPFNLVNPSAHIVPEDNLSDDD